MDGAIETVGSNGKSEMLAIERIGMSAMQNCGLECVIVRYNSALDIAVRFSDDVVVENKTYNSFLKGTIGHPTRKTPTSVVDGLKKKERLGMRKQMNSGHWVTIVGYNKATDISVQFDDGAIVNSLRWSEFVSGSISHPSSARVRDCTSRIGEKHVVGNGMIVKIIHYRSSTDLDIEFEDGTLVEHVAYSDVKRGRISHPIKKPIETMSLQEFAISFYLRNLGFGKIKQGEWEDKGFGRLELDFYNAEHNVAIEYDGAIHEMEKIVERDIKKNAKCKNLNVKLYRLRDPTLPELNDENSIDYTLDRDKRINDRLTDCAFELKAILNHCGITFDENAIDFLRDASLIIEEYKNTYINFYEKKHVGEVSYSDSAKMQMIITAYYDSHNIDVKFEDGATRTGITYGSFVGGRVKHPSQLFENVAKQRLGEVRTMNNGLEARIIAYRKSKDIDIEFVADGKRREHMTYHCFEQGKIRHPDTLLGNTSGYKTA
jgi:very-short-patch-repair endonuclease